MTPTQAGRKLLNWASQVDDNTLEQARETATMPFIHPHVALMPDAHSGKGSAVGTVIPTLGAVIPAAVGVDIGCVDADTEYLTPTGWKRIADFAEGDLVMQYDSDTRVGSFTPPQRYIVKDAPMFYHLRSKYGVDQMLTPDHKMLVYRIVGRDRRRIPVTMLAEDFVAKDRSLSQGFKAEFETSFMLDESHGSSWDAAQARVQVMTSADAHVENSRSILHLSKQRKIDRAVKLLADAGIDYDVHLNTDGTTNIRYPAPIRKGLEVFWRADAATLAVVADEVFHWDGNLKDGVYYTRLRGEADLVQYALTIGGRRSSLRADVDANGDVDYRVFSIEKTRIGIAGDDRTPIAEVPSVDGKAYCFTVPTGFLVLRRSGNVFITGNCGMIGVRTNLDNDNLAGRNLSELRAAIEAAIPLSPGNYNGHLERFTFTAEKITELEELAAKNDVDLTHSPKWREQLGSLGGGNHFIELCLDEEDRVWLFLHSGSRGVGNKIAQRHIKVAQELCTRWWIDLPNKDLAYLVQGTPEFERYIKDLNWAQRFAYLNRAEMMDRFRKVFADWIGLDENEIETERINCFAGETQVLTRTGAQSIADLAGGMHELLTTDGEWVKAPVKSFGHQEVSEVVLSRSGVIKTIRATAGHRWLLRTRRGLAYEATTAELKKGDRMQFAFPPKPEGRCVDRMSAARGFVFGDGSMKPTGNRSYANFCGTKDEVMIEFFSGMGNPLRTYGDVKRITGLPREWKAERPSLDAPASELYGWLAGYFAADGDVGKTGRPTLSSASVDNLEYVRAACHAVGIGTFGIRAHRTTGYYAEPKDTYLLGLMRADLDPDFFLIPDHRARFESGRHAAERRGWNVVSIRETGETTEVFCAVVEGTHAFALADNLLTGNCHHNYTRMENHFGKDVWLTRKGAVDAHEGVKGIIPGSMGTRSYVVEGLGSKPGLCSAPHGAGRRFSRTEARKRFTQDDLRDRMKGIEYRDSAEFIDEIPDAYKDIDVVMADASDLVKIVHELRQILNVKGT